MKTPMTRERLKHHLAYGSWKYLILIAAAIFGWNLIYTTTAYRPPEEKKVDFYVCYPAADSDALDAFMQEAWETALPDMEQVSAVTLMGSGGNDYYGAMQLTTYIMAGEGDVYLLKRDDFRSYAAQGAMLPLEELVEAGALRIPETVSLSKGYVTLTDEEAGISEKHLYGIPCAKLAGFARRLGIQAEDMYLCVMAAGKNDENALKFVQYVLDKLQ